MRSNCWWRAVTVLLLLTVAQEVLAFKPKTHIHLALASVDRILDGHDAVLIDGVAFAIDPDAAAAIRQHPSDYLAGVMGPDAFPDLLFGQAYVHPDRRCHYLGDPTGACDEGSGDVSWSLEWLRHVLDQARARTGSDRQRALAFAYGFLTHAAGDMWAHTFVNRFAEGSWPESLDTDENRGIALRHVLVEGVIGKHTPDITGPIASRTGSSTLTAPTAFIYDALIADPWANGQSRGSFVGRLLSLKATLEHERPDKPSLEDITIAVGIPGSGDEVALVNDWLMHQYIGCWMGEIEEGLRAWPATSLAVANELFVRERTTRIWDPILKTWVDEHLTDMLGKPLDPYKLLTDCVGIPGLVSNVLNPASAFPALVSDLVSRIPDFPFLEQIRNDFKNYLFRELIGMSHDEFMDYLTDPARHVTQSGLFSSSNALCEIRSMLGVAACANPPTMFNENQFAAAHDAVLFGKLVLMGPSDLDNLLFRYSAGPLFAVENSLEDGKKINAMLGYIRSLDGNHQWRDHAPPLPVEEDMRRFGNGMPLWKDCLARRFFRNVFQDWSQEGASTLYHGFGAENCSGFSHLPPVTATYSINGASAAGATYYGTPCGAVVLTVRLTNHQAKVQPYSILVTNEPLDGPQIALCTAADELAATTPTVTGSPVVRTMRRPLYLHRVFAGELPAIPTRGPTVTKDVGLFLPNCAGSYRLKVLLFAELTSVELPPFAHNPRIPTDPAAFLSDEVLSTFEANIEIRNTPCPAPQGCQPGQQNGTGTGTAQLMTENGPITIPLRMPCSGYRCQTAIPCDADQDGHANDRDVCPVTADPAQADGDGDGLGNACDVLTIDVNMRNTLKQWTDRSIADARWATLVSRFPELFRAPQLPGSSNPIPGDTLLASAEFRDYTALYVRGAVSEQQYTEQLRAVSAGIRTSGLPVRRAQLTSRREVRLQVGASGGRLTVQVPTLVLQRAGDPAARLRVLGAAGKPLASEQHDTGALRTLTIDVPKGERQVVIQRR